MQAIYDHRNIDASAICTMFGIADAKVGGYRRRVFDQKQFLAEVLQRAKTKAALARALDLPGSRISEIFSGERRLTMEEGMKLAEAFSVPPVPSVSAARLKPVLAVLLRYAPKNGWTDRDVQRLAEQLEYGLELLNVTATNPPSQDSIDLVERVIADRLRQERPIE